MTEAENVPVEALRSLILKWKDDPGATYRTWFRWDERLKNFRSIRRGIGQVVSEINEGTFGNVYKGSSLETVVRSIAEQRQMFKGADHAFLWKPKLRIPDIYEDRENQLAFSRFPRHMQLVQSISRHMQLLHKRGRSSRSHTSARQSKN